jgi:hypothetical protein
VIQRVHNNQILYYFFSPIHVARVSHVRASHHTPPDTASLPPRLPPRLGRSKSPRARRDCPPPSRLARVGSAGRMRLSRVARRDRIAFPGRRCRERSAPRFGLETQVRNLGSPWADG